MKTYATHKIPLEGTPTPIQTKRKSGKKRGLKDLHGRETVKMT